MRVQENNTPFLILAFLLTLGILATFQVYIMREPARIERVLASDQELAYEDGMALYADSCALCHGEDGEGDVGPALNSKELLSSVGDNTLFSLISSGVPGTAMPAWNQVHGGPLTDEQVRQLVVFVRAWESSAPEVAAGETAAPAAPAAEEAEPAAAGDPVNGQAVFEKNCVACHGADGEGGIGLPLNDQEKLAQFDNDWYVQVISEGRPAQGMPTWGTVLSPQDIADVVAFIRQWEDGE